MRDITTQRREEMKNELIFLTELSRFLNKKAPMLLQVCKTIMTIIDKTIRPDREITEIEIKSRFILMKYKDGSNLNITI